MGREVVETCDVCGRVVSDVLRDSNSQSLDSAGYGYIKAKRIRWRFGPFPRHVWHRVDLGWEIVCDRCVTAISEAARPPEDTTDE